MKKWDWYIFKKYLTTFFFTISLLAVVSIAIDLSEKISKLMDEPVTWKEIVFDYYMNFIPWILGLLTPVFVLISVIFFTGRLAKNNEIISMLNAGVSYRRMIRPYLLAGGLIASFLWIGGHYIIPKASKVKNTFENTYIFKSNRQVDIDNVHFFINPNEKAYVRYFRLRDTSMQGFRIETFEDNKLVKLLKSDKLEFKEPPNLWTLNNYSVREIHGELETMTYHTEKIDTILPFTPDDFISYINDMEMMTTPELRQYIDSQRSKGVRLSNKYILEVQRRHSDPVAIIILTLIGVSVSSRKLRGGMGLNLAIGVMVGASFAMLQRFSATFATGNLISPIIGMWVPNIVFLFVAIYLLSRAQK